MPNSRIWRRAILSASRASNPIGTTSANCVAAVAAMLLGLVQLGRMITGETTATLLARADYANAQFSEQPSQVAGGLVPATLLTLFTIPTFYFALERLAVRRAGDRKQAHVSRLAEAVIDQEFPVQGTTRGPLAFAR